MCSFRRPAHRFSDTLPDKASRPSVRLALGGATVAFALVTSGCASKQTPQATATPVRTTAATQVGTPRPTVSGPMTGQELVWIQAVEQLGLKMDKIMTDSPTFLTHATLLSMAQQLRGCSRELAQLGPPSTRLQQVYALVQQACQKFDSAANLIEADKVQSGFDAMSEGSGLMATAQGKADEIKTAVG